MARPPFKPLSFHAPDSVFAGLDTAEVGSPTLVSSRRAPDLPDLDPLDVIRRGLLHTQEYARAMADAERIYDATEKP